MHLEIGRDGATVVMTYTPGPGEPATPRRGRMVRRSARYETHSGPVHPDLLVLSALLTALPFVDRETPVTSSPAVSPALAEAAATAWGMTLADVDDDLAPRRAPADGVPALCFSGGTDSVATLALMPTGTRSYFLRRVRPAGDTRRTRLRLAASEASCRRVAELGYDMTSVDSDMEHLREPIGFADDLANAVPALLHADVDHLDAVAWGAPLEATYRLQVGRYRDFRRSPFVRTTGPLLRAVGIEPMIPVAGLSEVLTSLVVAEHPVGSAAQSCMRGPALGRPCLRCAKCARKTLLRGAVTGTWPEREALELMLREPEPRSHLLADPIKVEPVVAHCVHRYLADTPPHRRSEVLDLVAAKVGPDPLPWLRRSYEPALDLLPARYVAECRALVRRWAEPMSGDEEQAVVGYRLRPATKDPARADAQERLTAWYAAHPPPRPPLLELAGDKLRGARQRVTASRPARRVRPPR